MAITRLTNARIAFTNPAGRTLVSGLDATHMGRLDDGSMALGWSSASSGAEFVNITTVDSLGQTPSAIVQSDSFARARHAEHPKFASSATGQVLTVWGVESDNESATSGDTFGRFYNAAGNPTGPKFHLSTSATGGETSASVTRLGNGNFLTIWSDTRNTSGLNVSTDIMGRIVNASGAPVGAEFVANSATSGIQLGTDLLALGDGRAVAVWATGTASLGRVDTTGLKGRFINSAGAPAGSEFSIDTIANGSEYEFKTLELLALGNGGFVALWEEDAGTTEQIHFQRFASTGAKVGAEVTVESVSGDRHILNFFASELSNGGFAVAWRQNGAGLPNSSHVLQFNMNGAMGGPEVSLDQIAGSGGLTIAYDMELMSDGHVMTFGFRGANSVATQIFDFGDERLIGSSAADKLYGKEGVNDVILGLGGNDTILAFSGNDNIDGGTGNDTIRGGTGNDTLAGGLGFDALYGDAGGDTFVFNTAPNALTNRDTIGGFSALADTIRLSSATFAAITPGILSAAAFLQGAGANTATNATQRIIYNTANGALYYDADGDLVGGVAAVQFATLAGIPSITEADFLVV